MTLEELRKIKAKASELITRWDQSQRIFDPETKEWRPLREEEKRESMPEEWIYLADGLDSIASITADLQDHALTNYFRRPRPRTRR